MRTHENMLREVAAPAALLGLALTLGAAPLAADFVINDDLIVDGSACIGFDCVNGESFGFDTIRIKENNLRIKAEDTSVAASFPTQSWQLTFNESANGGLDKFSVECTSPDSSTPFTVEGCAPTHSLYVDDGGRIGLGTSTPSVELHIIDGDTPTLRLQQDGSSGFTPQTWDVAGNETNFFIRDVTNGSALPLRIRPGAASNSIFVENNDDVGLGTSSPTASLHVRRSDGSAELLVEEVSGTTATRAMLRLSNNGGSRLRFDNTNTSHSGFLQLENAANEMVFREANTGPGGGGERWRLNLTNGNVTIPGTLTSGGPTCGTGCDEVFSPDYPLESIEEHAAAMWRASHLPAVGPTVAGAPFNLTEKTGGMLNELEKAHIYIEQLHRRLADKEQAVATLEERLSALEAALGLSR